MGEITEKDVAHALLYRGSVAPIKSEVILITWTHACLNLFKDIQSYASDDGFLSIPTASLRSIFEINVSDVLLIRPYSGMKTEELVYASASDALKPFLIARSSDGFADTIEACIDDWIDNHLLPFMERYDLPDEIRDRLFTLLEIQEMYVIGVDEFNLLPWGQAENGTAVPTFSQHGYSITANDVALLLEGTELFPGLPPVMRVIGSDLGSNRAELITPVVEDFQEMGLFSFVCSISIETLPTVPYPLVYINVHRRRWVTSLKESFSHNKNAWSYLLDEKNCRAYTFKMTKKKMDDSTYSWVPDESFNALRQRFNLIDAYNTSDMLSIPLPEGLKMGIRHSFSTDGGGYAGKNKLGAGVTERDRVDVFSSVSNILQNFGFKIFEQFQKIASAKQALKSEAISYLDPVTLSMNLDEDKEALFESDTETGDSEGVTAISELVDSIASDWADMTSQYAEKKTAESSLDKAQKVRSMSELNQAIIASCFPEHRQLVMLLLCQDQKQQDAIKYIIEKIFGDSIRVVSSLLPKDVHGNKKTLPGADLKLVDRLQHRIEVWESFLEYTLKNVEVDMCLVQADEFYENNGKISRDDEVNKAASKIAFSSYASVPVQYLKPINAKIRQRSKQLEDYLNRIRSALYDLVFGHHGIVPAVPESTNEYFPSESSKPQYIYGVSALKVNERIGHASPSEIAIATRISTHSGVPEIKLCHFGAQLHVTDWLDFRSAIQYLCSRYNTKILLGTKKGQLTRQEIYRKFCESVFREANNVDGIIYLDAEHARSLCTWLGNTNVEAQGTRLRAAYPRLRIIRVRQHAPQLMVEKYREGYLSPTTCKRIFKITEGTLPVYWSLGLPLSQGKRGVSTYREIELPDGKGGTKKFSPFLKQAPTPNPVEFVVLSLPNDDSADKLIQYTTALRVGVLQANFTKFVSKPAPLFIMGKLREYFEL